MKKRGFEILILMLALLFIPALSADVISINSGGNNEVVINPDAFIEGFFSSSVCMPFTCSALGYNCDSWSDGCGGTINCGSCSSGYVCTSGICTLIPVPPVTPPSGPGGGGGGAAPSSPILTDLKAVPTSFDLESSTNLESSAKLDMQNTGSMDLTIVPSLTNSLKDIVSFDKSVFTLKPGESKTFILQVVAPAKAGIYTGKIIFSSMGKVLEVPFVLNVRSGISLFDISLDIASSSRIIRTGDKLTGQVSLIQKGAQAQMDVSVHYIVKDYEDNIYLEESETLMVDGQKNYEHEFNTENLPAGKYIIGAEVIYSGGVATASYPFQVVESKVNAQALIYVAILFVLITLMVAISVIIKYYKRQNLRYNKRRIK